MPDSVQLGPHLVAPPSAPREIRNEPDRNEYTVIVLEQRRTVAPQGHSLICVLLRMGGLPW